MGLTEVTPLLTIVPVAVMGAALREQKNSVIVLFLTLLPLVPNCLG